MPQKNNVDFIYIGGPRCGSTWLAAILADHPGIFVPPSKEVHFFNDRMPYDFEYRYPHGIEYYREFFADAKEGQKIGDLSPFYFLDPNAAWRIHHHFPHVKLIAFLRDPVDMLYSLYLLLRQRERREATFERELEVHPELIDLCRYDRLLQPFHDLFDAENILVLIQDDIKADPKAVARRVYDFLGVDPQFDPPSLDKAFNLAVETKPTAVGQSRGLAIRLLNRPFLRPVKDWLVKRGAKDIRRFHQEEHFSDQRYRGPSPEIRAQLGTFLQPDLERLERRIGRDLGNWRTYRKREA
ncbi:MAG: sulfotransferase [Geminicoccaceae bacterium]|nr:sulfotransferase [Geminicoccaceae bacterium]